ncbi:MAG TPA: tetratricopeptide repeat protein [Myxococcaceae bacterium]|nr:tetratricopeptide repeat protein [Myxococcaceae bacterium]
MRRLPPLLLLLLSTLASAQTKQAPSLSKKTTAEVDSSLAGDLTRQKQETAGAPLQYDQFRLGIELQVADKRREQIESLKKIIQLSPDQKEQPSLLFRLADLYWEESRYYFFEGSRKDDDLIRALAAKDASAEAQARQQRDALMAQRDVYAKLAIETYTEIVQRYKDFERTDEVLYFLGHNLMDMGEERKALVAYNRLVEKYPKSKYLPDAYLAFGEYYFNNSRAKREFLTKALENYKKAASYVDSAVYGFALYKEGWCYFNLVDYAKAMDLWKAVVLYGEFSGASALEKAGGAKGKSALIREARRDFVRAYERSGGTPDQARTVFPEVARNPDDLWEMYKTLANLYYDQGNDKFAALAYFLLIKERPLSPEAPGFQAKIVDCVLREGNKKITVAQVRRLVKIIGDVEKSGNVKTEADQKAVADAKKQSEVILSNLAVNWHNEGRKTRDDDTFAATDEVYGDYLALFPDSPKAYDLRFFWAELLHDNLRRYDKAAEQYTLVVKQDARRIDGEKDDKGGYKVRPEKPGKWLPLAAYDSVYAWDEVVKRAEEKGELKSESSADLSKPLTIPPVKKELLDATERYLKYVPKGEKRVEVAYKAARIYYDYHRYDEAVARFSEIALNYPDYRFDNGDRAGEIAANLVLDSYNGLGNFQKVNEWARRFYANDRLATGKFRDDLSKIIEQSSFKLVAQQEQRGEYQQAAEAYLAFVRDFPRTEIADKALYNASVDFFKAHLFERALETRERLFKTYPKSPLVPLCIWANAEGYESIGDFERAADAYEAYVQGYQQSRAAAAPPKRSSAKNGKKGKKGKAAAPEPPPKGGPIWEEAKAQVALYNAAVYREGLGQLKASLRDRELYLELFPTAKDADAVGLSIADLEERTGQYGKAIAFLEQRVRDNQRDPDKALSTLGRLQVLYETKLKDAKGLARTNRQVLDEYERLPARVRKDLQPPALEAVARASLQKNEEQFQYYARLKLRWGRAPDPTREFKESLAAKTRALEEVNRLYTATVAYQAGGPAICALEKIGLAYENMAESIANAPAPKFLPPDAQDALRDQLAQQAEPVKEKAAEHFAAAVAKSRELGISNSCSAESLKLLRTTYRPDQFPTMPEELAALPLPRSSSRPPALLTQVQPPVPGVVLKGPSAGLPSPRAVNGAKTAALPAGVRQDDSTDLKPGQRPVDSKGPPPPPRAPTTTAQGTLEEPGEPPQ